MCFLLQRGDASKEMLIIHQIIYNRGGATFNRRAVLAGEQEEVV